MPLWIGMRATPLWIGMLAAPLWISVFWIGMLAMPLGVGMLATPLRIAMVATPLWIGVLATPFLDRYASHACLDPYAGAGPLDRYASHAALDRYASSAPLDRYASSAPPTHTHKPRPAPLKPRQSLFTLSRTQRRQPLLPKLIEVHSYVVMSKGASTPLQNHIETAGRSTLWTTAGTLVYPKGLIFVLKATPSQGESGNSYLMLDHSHTRAHTHTHLITEIIKWNRSTNV